MRSRTPARRKVARTAVRRPRTRAVGDSPRVPLRSRVTVRRAVAALRSSRESLTSLEAELAALLTAVRAGGQDIDAGTPDRLRAITRGAGEAVEALGGLRPLLRRQR